MTRARSTQISLDSTSCYRCTGPHVRRALLMSASVHTCPPQSTNLVSVTV